MGVGAYTELAVSSAGFVTVFMIDPLVLLAKKIPKDRCSGVYRKGHHAL